MRLPFNRKTPIGYGVGYLIETFALIVNCHIAIMAVGVLIGFYGITISFGLILQRKFSEIFENFKIERNQEKIKLDLGDTIKLQTDLKMFSITLTNLVLSIFDVKYEIFNFRLVAKFTNIFEITVTLYYVWSILAICDSLLVFHVRSFCCKRHRYYQGENHSSY